MWQNVVILLTSRKKNILTLKTFKASSQTCIPRDSKTSTQPKYFTENVHVPDRTAVSSACHWWGLELSGTRSFRLRKESLKDLLNLSIFRGDLKLRLWKNKFCIIKLDKNFIATTNLTKKKDIKYKRTLSCTNLYPNLISLLWYFW